MRDANAEVWLTSQHIEHELRESARRAGLPPRASWVETARRWAGEALIAVGRRLLPAPKRTPARAT